MSSQEESSEKSHEPSPRKLEKAREKGDIVRSSDVNVSLAYLGCLLLALSYGSDSALQFGSNLQRLFEEAARTAPRGADAAMTYQLRHAIWPGVLIVLTFIAMPAALVLIGLITQRAIVFAPDKLKPKFDRLSLIKNAKNKFGRNGWFEFFKSFVKLLVFSMCLAGFIYWNLDIIVGAARAQAQATLLLLGRLWVGLLAMVLVVSACIAVIDYLWQYHEHHRKNRMSHKELSDEYKESEGDPHLKQKRREKAHSITTSHMLTDVPEADVVIVNPTHFAVALKWSGSKTDAPECIAKGVDEIARRIRETAQDADVPLYSDPPTARALYAVVEIGEQIHPEHYAAVAVAISFAENLKRKKHETF